MIWLLTINYLNTLFIKYTKIMCLSLVTLLVSWEECCYICNSGGNKMVLVLLKKGAFYIHLFN